MKIFGWKKKCLHKLPDILFIGLLTFLSSGEDYEDMVLFGKTHYDFLKDYLSLPNGISSHDTFRRVFSMLDSDVLGKCLTDYGQDIMGLLSEKQICLDGKKHKGVCPTSRGNSGFYIVNAWVAENRLCIGQKKVQDKSNEITAIPSLIDELDVTDAVVSIDAMGCQREIAIQIVDKGGNYLLSLKENQQELYDDVVCGFKACSKLVAGRQSVQRRHAVYRHRTADGRDRIYIYGRIEHGDYKRTICDGYKQYRWCNGNAVLFRLQQQRT